VRTFCYDFHYIRRLVKKLRQTYKGITISLSRAKQDKLVSLTSLRYFILAWSTCMWHLTHSNHLRLIYEVISLFRHGFGSSQFKPFPMWNPDKWRF